MEPEVILEQWSPVCDIQAFVEKSNKAYYFYLWINPHSEEPEVRSSWICNRVKATKEMDYESMNKGEAPSMPLGYIKHDENGIELDEDSLWIQWFEEGDAAALLSGNEIIAVIPCFSGYQGFNGYSKYAVGTGPFAWALDEAMDAFKEKVERSKAFWDYLETDFWGEIQQEHLARLEDFFGKYEKYYAIDGNKFPPKALVTGRKDGVLYGITAGVSLIPMPKVEMTYQEVYKDYRRMELGFACTEKHEPLTKSMYSVISSIAAFPWREITFLGHGHTIPYSNIKGFSHLLFINAKEVKGLETPAYKGCFDEAINLLWVIPIKESEQVDIMTNGIEAYLEKKDQQHIHIFD